MDDPVDATTLEAVDEAIEAREDEMVAFLSDLVAARSVTGDEAPAQEVVIPAFEGLGLEPDVWEPDAEALREHPSFFETSSFVEVGYEGRPNVVAVLEGVGGDGDEERDGDRHGPAGRTLTLSGHVDVVSVDADAWSTDPWTLVRDDDILYGRGAADMKGGIAAYLTAVRALREVGVDLAGDLILQTTIEEEDGGVGGVLSALERGYRPDAAVVPEPFEVPNVGVASGGVMYFRVTVPGRTAHAGSAFEGVDALGKAVAVYEALQGLDRERKARIEYPRAARADPRLEGHVTNINVGAIEGGDWPSTVPGEVVLSCRVGWPPGETREEVREQVREAVRSVEADDEWLAEHPPELEWFGWQAEPHEVSEESDLARLAMRAGEDVTGDPGQFIGGSAGLDERFYANDYDIDAVTVGPAGERLHGPDECTTVPSLLDAAKTHARIAMGFCGVASGPE
jgi:acetylornithine deacetylase